MKRGLKRATLLKRAVAWHEAGHAVMCLVLGGQLNPNGVYLNADGTGYAGVRFLDYGSAETEYNNVLINLAGWHAECKWHKLAKPRTSDDVDVRWALDEVRGDWCDEDEDKNDDHDSFEKMLAYTPHAKDEDLLKRYDVYSAMCAAILDDPMIWAVVEAVATKLWRRRKLQHKAVASCAANWSVLNRRHREIASKFNIPE